MYRVPCLLAPLFLSSSAQAQDLLFDLDLGSYSTRTAILGDVNGDGVSDLLAGSSTIGVGVGVATVISGLDGSSLYQVQGTTGSPQFASSLAGVGDLDGDGVMDFVCKDHYQVGSGFSNAGAVHAYSGATGTLLHSSFGETAGMNLGSSLSALGDWNSDGYDDYATRGMREESNGLWSGFVRILSGQDGGTLHELNGTGGPQDDFGSSIASIGDIDSDGVRDILVGSRLGAIGGPVRGYVQLFSGATSASLGVIDGAIGDYLGAQVGDAGDWNGDGTDDFWALASEALPSGELRVYSGSDFSILGSFRGHSSEAETHSASLVGDLDGDGVSEVWLGCRQTDLNGILNSGVGLMRSGATGQVLFFVQGLEINERLGDFVGPAGDLDGNGVPEFLIANLSGELKIYRYSDTDSPQPEAVIVRSFEGVAGDWFGYSVAGAGDQDGDGIEDIVVASPKFVGAYPIGGKVEVLSSPSGNRIGLFTNDPNNYGNSVDFGWSVDGGIDIQGGPKAEILVGEPSYRDLGTGRGAAYIFGGDLSQGLGALQYFLVGDGSSHYFGTSVCLTEDLDGNGRGDFVVGAPKIHFEGQSSFSPGYARLFQGDTGLPLLTLTGQQNSSGFGWSVADAGDVDGDGLSDVIVGAPFYDGAFAHSGRAGVYSGLTGVLLYSVFGAGLEDHFGHSVAGVGDLNGDGFAEFLVGAPQTAPGGPESGSAFLYSGFDGSLIHEWHGSFSGDRLGYTVASLADVDGDGIHDIALGVPYEDSEDLDAGAVRIYSGRTRELLMRNTGDRQRAFFGMSVASTSDLTGDGLAEMLVGSPQDLAGGQRPGKAMLLSRPDFLTYCHQEPNSSGSPAGLWALGSASVSDNNLTLHVQSAPASQMGIFFFGPNHTQQPFGDGTLCIAGSIVRLGPPQQTTQTGATSRQVLLNQAPAFGVLLPGTRFGFQFWYRDPSGGPAGYSFTNALNIAFK